MEALDRTWVREVPHPAFRWMKLAVYLGWALAVGGWVRIDARPAMAVDIDRDIALVSAVMLLTMVPLVMREWSFARKRLRPIRLSLRDGRLMIDGRDYAPLSRLAFGGAWVDPMGIGRVAILRQSRRPAAIGDVDPLVLRLESLDEGEALLRTLGMDGRTRHMELTTYRDWSAWQVLLAVVVYVGLSVVLSLPTLFVGVFEIAQVPLIAIHGPIFLAGAIALVLLFGLARKRVSIGLDGVGVERTFSFTRRFVPYSQIRRVWMDGRALRLDTADESLLLLERARLELPTTNVVLTQALIHQRIQHALDGASAVVTRVELARGSRSVDAWLAALRGLGAGASRYRDGALSVDALERQLDDSSAEVSVRLGAALALRVADPSASARIVAAGATSAARAFRVALQAIAHDPMDARLGVAFEAALTS